MAHNWRLRSNIVVSWPKLVEGAPGMTLPALLRALRRGGMPVNAAVAHGPATVASHLGLLALSRCGMRVRWATRPASAGPGCIALHAAPGGGDPFGTQLVAIVAPEPVTIALLLPAVQRVRAAAERHGSPWQALPVLAPARAGGPAVRGDDHEVEYDLVAAV